MSDWWAAQIDNLEGTVEIFCKLTSATEGGASTHASYNQFRASRLQLRFAQDLVTVIQFKYHRLGAPWKFVKIMGEWYHLLKIT